MIRLSDNFKLFAATASKFLLVGGLSTIIEITVFNVAIYAFHSDVVTAKIIASLIALINAYFGNRQWAFKGHARRGRSSEIIWFLAVNIFCLLLGTALVWFGESAFASARGYAPGPLALNLINIASILAVVVVRFLLYRFIVFKAPSAKG